MASHWSRVCIKEGGLCTPILVLFKLLLALRGLIDIGHLLLFLDLLLSYGRLLLHFHLHSRLLDLLLWLLLLLMGRCPVPPDDVLVQVLGAHEFPPAELKGAQYQHFLLGRETALVGLLLDGDYLLLLLLMGGIIGSVTFSIVGINGCFFITVLVIEDLIRVCGFMLGGLDGWI